jgi:hypothetical protein
MKNLRWKLQLKTLLPLQIIGYCFTLLIGCSILILSVQIYVDIKPLLQKNTDAFNENATVISKQISVFKSMNKEKIYFTKEEIETIKTQAFIKDVSYFKHATFKVNAYTTRMEDMPPLYTDLFFESIPQTYLDVESEEWHWDELSDFIPIVVPENYLNLYNFGFAESQGLPVISQQTIAQMPFNIRINGNGKTKEFSSKIVGFSTKINSILVPENFLDWANKVYGRDENHKINRLLLTFKDPTDKRILHFFNEQNYQMNEDNLALSKMVYFFKAAMSFIFVIALLIVILSLAFVILSFNLIIQKNKELIVNLYSIGIATKRIGAFYQLVVIACTLLVLFFAFYLSSMVRSLYIQNIQKYIDFSFENNQLIIFIVLFAFILVPLLYFTLLKMVQKAVKA